MGFDNYRLSLFQYSEEDPRMILYFDTETEVKIMHTMLESSWHMPKEYKLEKFDADYYNKWIECDLEIFMQ